MFQICPRLSLKHVADLVASVVIELHELSGFVTHDKLTVAGTLAFAVGRPHH